MQGLLPLEMLKVATKGWYTNIIVVEVKCHFSCVQIIHITQLITSTMLISGTIILELQLSANKME